jgi:molybdopterin-guanine dinucleotide biosynthesis protein A
MGQDKAFIPFEGEPLVARVLARVGPLCAETIMVTNSPERYTRFGTRMVADIYPGKGSLGGIYSGLMAAQEPHALVIACDMPFLNQDLLHYMFSLAPDFDVVIPRAKDPSGKTPRRWPPHHPSQDPTKLHPDWIPAKRVDLHPTHAVYSKNCLPVMQARLQRDDLRIIGILDDLNVRVVEVDEVDRFDPQHLSFFNMNTPQDLEFATRIARESR